MRTKHLRETLPGWPTPLGATLKEQGVNFALFSQHATAVTLSLFSQDGKLLDEFFLDPKTNKTGTIWHVCIKNLQPPGYYAYKIDGPKEGDLAFRYDPSLYLLDPYAKEVSTTNHWGISKGPRKEYRPLGAVLADPPFDWQGIESPRHPLGKTILYEMHVRGFTQHSSSGVAQAGTFLGAIEKIPYLKELGITAVELLPIFEFNENEVMNVNPATKKKLFQYWGYSTINFFAPMNRYATESKIGAATQEFKTLVRELHRNGIEVILDVVFNHTGEGNQDGPILSFKGIDNPVYYICEPDKSYANYTGCGNTLNCNHPVVRDFILECLRYWVLEMHVDGFRFDLASIMLRGRQGQPMELSPLVEAISADPILADTKLIAEPWDAAGLYHVGVFYPQEVRWQEWNGKYRDAIRKFIKGTPGTKGEFSTRVCGSQDLYHNRTPTTSVNFVVVHDGFSLYDLVSYNGKHNEDNGEQNRDGTNDNESWNCGQEGETEDQNIRLLRQKQIRNFHLAEMISLGMPMLQMGDEYAHSKRGNNNTWCQDNELSWFRWDRLEENQGFKRFFTLMNHFRLNNPILQQEDRFLGEPDITFHGIEPGIPDWSPENMFIAYTLNGENPLYIAFNSKAATQIIEFPDPPEGKNWHLIVNTAVPSPKDFVEEKDAPPLGNNLFKMQGYSGLLLKAY